jgi:hypothetical protein
MEPCLNPRVESNLSSHELTSIKHVFQSYTENCLKDERVKCVCVLINLMPAPIDCSLVLKHNSKLNGFQTIQMSQVFLHCYVKVSQVLNMYSITREQLLIYVLHDQSIYRYLCLHPLSREFLYRDFPALSCQVQCDQIVCKKSRQNWRRLQSSPHRFKAPFTWAFCKELASTK